jgi:hypothetical protein
MAVGTMEMVLAAMLGLLAAIAAASLGVALVASIWLSVTPVFAKAANKVQQWRWRDWHPPTQWVPDDVEPDEPRPLWPPRVRGMSYLPAGADGSAAPDGTVGLVTAQVATSARTCGPQYELMTMVHTRLTHPTTLDLPVREGCSTMLYVLGGEGTVGADHQAVQAGETALVASGPVPVVADGRGLEMLVLERVPTAAAESAAEAPAESADAAEAAEEHRRRPIALAAKVLHPRRPAHA